MGMIAVGKDVKHTETALVAAIGPTPSCALARAGDPRAGQLFAALLIAFIWLLPVGFAGDARARIIELEASGRTTSITVSIGKSENIHAESNFADVVVGDPEIADVVPLSDHSLSILGKKIGTTRVSVYAQGKQLVGVIDIEVAYDTTKLGAELSRRFPQARFKVTSVNGRIML